MTADELKRIRDNLDRNATPAVNAFVNKIRDDVRKDGLTFQIGVTPVSDKDIRQITGALPSTPAELAELPEKAAVAAETEAQRTARAPNDPTIASGGIVADNGAPATLGASYYAEATTVNSAAPWMDPATYPLPETCTSTASKWITRDALPPVRDQKLCGSCWAFSSVGALEISQGYWNGAFYDFSEQSVLDCATTSILGIAAGSCDGGRPDRVFDYFGAHGPSFEAAAPYQARKATCSSVKQTAYTRIATGPVDTVPEKLKSAICKYGSVSAGIHVTAAFQNYRGGTFDEPKASRTMDHAIVLVGWDDSKGAWLLRNSWTNGWGEAGYAWVRYGTNGVGSDAYWIAAAPGDGGSKGAGSDEGAFYTRTPVIRNSSGEAVTLNVQYLGWTGTDGLRWLPQTGAWYNYTIPSGYVGKLRSPFVGNIRASEIRLYAQNSAGTKKWTTYQTASLNMVSEPERGYWATSPQDFEIEVTSSGAMVPKTTMPVTSNTSSSTQCAKWSISNIRFNASTAYSWDTFSPPDIYLELVVSGVARTSDLSSDSFTKNWSFPSKAPLYLTSGQAITLNAYDRDLRYDDDIESIAAVVPASFSSGSWKKAASHGDMEFTGTCAQSN